MKWSAPLYTMVKDIETERLGVHTDGRGGKGQWLVGVVWADGTRWQYDVENNPLKSLGTKVWDYEHARWNPKAPKELISGLRKAWALDVLSNEIDTLMHEGGKIVRDCWFDELGLLDDLMKAYLHPQTPHGMGNTNPGLMRWAWRFAFQEELPDRDTMRAVLTVAAEDAEALRCDYFAGQKRRDEERTRARVRAAVEAGAYEGRPQQASLF